MAFFFYIFKAFAWGVSKLPFPLLYLLSDMMSFFLRIVVRYRKKVVFENLSRSFPDKSRKEIHRIARKFYRNLSDIIVEVIKQRSITRNQLMERFTFLNYELFEQTFARGKSIILATGHSGNWEWMGAAVDLRTPQKGYAIVKPLSDRRFHDYMEMLRHRITKGGTIPFKETYRTLVKNKKEELTFNVFAADQTPIRDEINYWAVFLNQDTPFFLGIDRIARSLDFAVIFVDTWRTGRGRYCCEFSMITGEPKLAAEFEIMNNYIRKLEEAIIKRPDNWLWSHRRWKYKREA
jgi:KDO2-lipid IV(A) lauroyltransferase